MSATLLELFRSNITDITSSNPPMRSAAGRAAAQLLPIPLTMLGRKDLSFGWGSVVTTPLAGEPRKTR
jgi:hypothetical protein